MKTISVKIIVGSLALATSALAQNVVWDATTSSGSGDAPVPGQYYATNGVNFYNLTWGGSGQGGLDVTSSSLFNNTFSMYMAADTPSASSMFNFNAPITDADGLVDSVFEFQRGNYSLTLFGGATWTSSSILTDLTGLGGYTVTGVGTSSLLLTRTSNPDINAFSIDYRFGLSGSFTGLQYTWTPDGTTTNGSTGITNDLIGLRFGTLTAAPVPESSSLIFMSLGALVCLRRKRAHLAK